MTYFVNHISCNFTNDSVSFQLKLRIHRLDMAGERTNGDNGGNGQHAQKAVGKAVLKDETDVVLMYPLPSA